MLKQNYSDLATITEEMLESGHCHHHDLTQMSNVVIAHVPCALVYLFIISTRPLTVLNMIYCRDGTKHHRRRLLCPMFCGGMIISKRNVISSNDG